VLASPFSTLFIQMALLTRAVTFFLGQKHSNSFSQHLVEGRNRVVITQVDDCQVENNIVATVAVNGKTLSIPTCTRCLDGYNMLNAICVQIPPPIFVPPPPQTSVPPPPKAVPPPPKVGYQTGSYYPYNAATESSGIAEQGGKAQAPTQTATGTQPSTTVLTTTSSGSSTNTLLGVMIGLVAAALVVLVLLVVVLLRRGVKEETV